MAKLKEEKMKEALKQYLTEGEEVKNVAFGVKQPPFIVILLLMLLAILPGVIATFLLTKNYIISLTNKRFLILQVKSMSNAEVKAIVEYDLSSMPEVKTSTGGLFTHFKVLDEQKPFAAKCHRAYSKTNRENAMAIAEGIKA